MRMLTLEIDNAMISVPTAPFIANEYVSSGAYFDIINPATNKTIVAVEEGNKELVAKAIDAAKKAFDGEWGQLEGSERGDRIRKIADVIEQNRNAFMMLETINMGKPLDNANFDIDEVIGVFKYYAGLADKICGYTTNLGMTKFGYTTRAPIGVVGHIIPWNFPLPMLAWKLGPALAAGCCSVVKPSEFTPLSALYLTTFLSEILPAGVVNVIPGNGHVVGKEICNHSGISKIAFTGSCATGVMVMREAAGKKVTLECGGKNPCLIFEDADIEKATDGAIMGGYFNSGQVCCATSRFYIQDAIFDKYIEVLKKKMNNIVVGDPMDPKTTMGPMANQLQYEKAKRFLKMAKDEGIEIIEWEGQLPPEGLYIKPVIFPSLPHDHTLARMELFSPFISLHKFSTEQEAIDLANDSELGLAAAVFTKDLSRASRATRKINAGIVWVNSNGDSDFHLPFGGWGRSGVGNELGLGSVNDYTKEKSVYINLE